MSRRFESQMYFFFFQAEDGIRDGTVTGVQTCALPISITSPEYFLPIALVISHDSPMEQNGPSDSIRLPTTCNTRPRQRRVDRSEERRVGKECRSRWSRYH